MTAHPQAATGSRLAGVLNKFLETKTNCDLEGTMSYFAADMASYIDATLGWDLDSYEPLKGVFAQYMPNWAPAARSTPPSAGRPAAVAAAGGQQAG
jgi:hypothetical protein